ncbi:MAG: Ribosomal RNA large subunit methyltransferase E [Phycisphaerales bacterium]|nr:Ribosomal RNA large subunit methyltransferase E [Phycisphaerales bacterium]MCK6475883.1 RlmE family RNA methyltransferase [Phycisphaerales bacterium]
MAQPRKLHDKYFKQAKAEGYLARSAYKLMEINERRPVIKAGDAVLDLGCAPGSWVQVASDLVGPRGLVVGIDLLECSPLLAESVGSNVHCMVADVFKVDARTLLEAAGSLHAGSSGFDAVISDMAPNTTGHGDDLLSARLCRRVLEVLPRLLRPGGNLVMKIFEGSEYQAVVLETREVFREAKGFKPKACREVSRETYIVAYGYRPPADAPSDRPRPSRAAPAPPAPPPGWNR